MSSLCPAPVQGLEFSSEALANASQASCTALGWQMPPFPQGVDGLVTSLPTLSAFASWESREKRPS